LEEKEAFAASRAGFKPLEGCACDEVRNLADQVLQAAELNVCKLSRCKQKSKTSKPSVDSQAKPS